MILRAKFYVVLVLLSVLKIAILMLCTSMSLNENTVNLVLKVVVSISNNAFTQKFASFILTKRA